METACSPKVDSDGDCRDKFKKNGSKDSPKSYSVMFSLGPLSPFISLQVTYMEPLGIIPRTFTENLLRLRTVLRNFSSKNNIYQKVVRIRTRGF